MTKLNFITCLKNKKLNFNYLFFQINILIFLLFLVVFSSYFYLQSKEYSSLKTKIKSQDELIKILTKKKSTKSLNTKSKNILNFTLKNIALLTPIEIEFQSLNFKEKAINFLVTTQKISAVETFKNNLKTIDICITNTQKAQIKEQLGFILEGKTSCKS